MFTGIVELYLQCTIDGDTLTINNVWDDVCVGESIAIDGVCLTVDTVSSTDITFRLLKETLDIVHFSSWVNVERAMVYGKSRVGGHHVTGHVNETGVLTTRNGEAYIFLCSSSHLLQMKGSITINGVSLTINEVTKDGFRVNLIAKTLDLTNLSLLREGDVVNIEYEHVHDEIHPMQEALRLADTHRQLTWPNPWVGCVIVDSNDKIVARGVHRGVGTLHAEADALKNFIAHDDETYTMYVTLEPCNHTGRTPPCTEAIINAGIKKVVYGVEDPDERVRGSGLQKLRESGITVEQTPEYVDIRKSLLPYLIVKRRKQPWCVAKIAESLDGSIALQSGESMWITSEQSREHFRTHVKNSTQAIIMGVNTAFLDNPLCENGRYVFIDTHGRLEHQKFHLFSNPQTLIFTHKPFKCAVECIASPLDESGKVDVEFIEQELWRRGVLHYVVEGGPTLQQSFLENGLVDEVYMYTAGKMLGSYAQRWSNTRPNSVLATTDEWILKSVEKIENDVLRIYKPLYSYAQYTLSSISEALEEFDVGGMVIVMDDESRENEGDLIVSGSLMTVQQMAAIIQYTTGIVCVSIDEQLAQQLELPPMLVNNGDAKGTAFTVTCDAKSTSTGVSALDRLQTVQAIVNGDATKLNRPGHMFPLVARSGGVLERRGHTEAAYDLCRLTNQPTVGVIGELQAPDGHMMRFRECAQLAAALDIPIISIQQIADECARQSMDTDLKSIGIAYTFESECPIHIRNLGEWTMRCYPSSSKNTHRVIIKGNVSGVSNVMVRVHSECFTGDVLGSELCDCGQQLRTALEMIASAGAGVLIMPADHEGRGIGLSNKVRAYQLIQSTSINTYEANTQLGFEEDEREYGDCLRILQDLGVDSITLLTSNPHKIAALKSITNSVQDITPLPSPKNEKYLEVKRERHAEIYPTKQLLTDMPTFPSVDGKRVGIVRANWHHQLLVPLEDKIREHLHALGITDITTHVVPGSLEVIRATIDLEYDAIVWLGILIKGETAHFEYVSQAIMHAFTDLQLRHKKTLVNGIMHCYTLEQARERCVGDAELSHSLATTTAYMAGQ